MKYRIKEFDIPNDIWIVQRKLFWFIWVDQFAITGLDKAKDKVSLMNARYDKDGSRWYAQD